MYPMNSRMLLLFATVALSGCVTSYYKHVKTGYEISAGADTGPRGDKVEINPRVMEQILVGPGSNLRTYYEILVDWSGDQGPGKPKKKSRWPSSSLLTKAAFRDVLLDLNELDRRIRQEGSRPGVPRQLRYVRLAAAIITPHVVKSIKDNGYARVTWGHKLDREPPGISMGVHMFYITVHKEAKVVRYHQSDLFSMLSKLSPTEYDVSAVEQTWQPGADIPAAELAKIKKK